MTLPRTLVRILSKQKGESGKSLQPYGFVAKSVEAKLKELNG